MPSLRMPSIFQRKTAEVNTNTENSNDHVRDTCRADTRSLTSSSKNAQPFSFKNTVVLTGGILSQAFQSTVHSHSTSKLEELYADRSKIQNAINGIDSNTNISSETKSDIINKMQTKLNDINEKIDKHINNKTNNKKYKAEVKQKWKEASTSEKITAVALTVSSPITVPTLGTLGVVVGGVGYGVVSTADSIKNSNAYTTHREQRDEKNAKFAERRTKYEEDKNTASANRFQSNGEKQLAQTARRYNIDVSALPQTPATAQNPRYRAAVAAVRSTHVIRDIPIIGLSDKYDTNPAPKISKTERANSFGKSLLRTFGGASDIHSFDAVEQHPPINGYDTAIPPRPVSSASTDSDWPLNNQTQNAEEGVTPLTPQPRIAGSRFAEEDGV